MIYLNLGSSQRPSRVVSSIPILPFDILKKGNKPNLSPGIYGGRGRRGLWQVRLVAPWISYRVYANLITRGETEGGSQVVVFEKG